MSNRLTVDDLNVVGQKVLVRVDYNVPFDKNGAISDDSRIEASLPTLISILDRGGAVIAMSHLGRPDGKRDEKFSLKPCAERLSKLIGRPVMMAPDCVGPQVEAMAAALNPGQILLLENLRFYKAEEKPDSDPTFAKRLASLATLYVNDAFGTAHRRHSSTATVAEYFPGRAAAGLLMIKEIENLGANLLNPQRPFYAIIGGAKVSSKLGVLKALANKADALMIGGGMAFTLLKALGYRIGNSLCEEDRVAEMKTWLEDCQKRGIPIILPEDLVIADAFDNNAKRKIVSVKEGIPDGWQGLDIGPKSIERVKQWLSKAHTILWNGPVGVFEFPNFAQGTLALANALATSPAHTVIGGGDSVAAIHQAGVADQISHISTGGGASLEYIELGTLPGIEALSKKESPVKN